MFRGMFETLGTWVGNRARAWLGAAGLHMLAILVLLSVTFKPLQPNALELLSIELVDARPIDPVTPVQEPEPEPELPEPISPIVPPPEPEQELELVPDPEPEPLPAQPQALPPQSAIIRSPPPPAPAQLEDDDEEDEIPPQYLIRRDPMLETAPSASARVSASVMCARTNRETRPAFCPEIGDEDIRFAELARAQGDFGGYSPRDETLFARSTFNRFALEPGYEGFRERQENHRAIGSTGGTPIVRSGMKIRRHAEALENCTPVRTGVARTGGVEGLSTELSNGSDVFCD